MRKDLLTAALLLCLLLAGGWLRYNGLNWDDFTFLHPDERFLTDVASSIGGRLQSTEADDAARSAHSCPLSGALSAKWRRRPLLRRGMLHAEPA